MEEVSNNFKLQLDELLESKEYEQTREAVDDLIYSIDCICDPDDSDEYPIKDIVKGVKDFLSMIPRHNMKKSMDHLLLFQFRLGINALVSLFDSPIKGNKEIAEESIRLFLINNPKLRTGVLPTPILNQCALIVIQLCVLLSDNDDQCLYNSCRETLVSILKSIAFANRSTYFGFAYRSLCFKLLYPLISEQREKLCSSLSTLSNCSKLCLRKDVREFALFSLYMRRAIEEHVRSKGQSLPLSVEDNFDQEHPCYLYEIECFYRDFMLLLSEVRLCLCELNIYPHRGARGLPKFNPMWSNYLTLLKELNDISKLYQGAENEYFTSLEDYWFSINYLVIHSNRSDQHQWIREHNNEKVNEFRRHLMMFPEVKPDDEKRHIMLIDRSRFLTESFEDIANTNPKSLHNGLSVMFKNEGASGTGVLREWFFLVCQALFDPENSLFLACPSDRRRFFPNPAKVDPQHLKYFGFCGRAIALALKHKVQVGIAFDRVFSLQLAGKKISLEDVRYADPCLYKSCKAILEMDADFVDSDALGLTFVREIEEFGSRKVVELCPGGNTICVNSKNREEYVNLLIQHCFVKSISAKVAYFARGFGNILYEQEFQKIFFQSLELQELDCLLLGSDKAICVKDWKAHTDYDDYKETDDQICWFWKVVEGMSQEQQRTLLFFWTSVKYLPVNGFSGLSSRLYIYKTKGSQYHLPSSHTCFLRLGLPHYPSLDVTQQHLYLFCQEHVGCSFGLS